jgi:hypothetical protein
VPTWRRSVRSGRLAAASLGVVFSVWTSSGKTDPYGAPPPNVTTDLERLVRSYPDWVAGYDETFLILKDGKRFAISDSRTNKSFNELLERPDIDDMFFVPYPAGSTPKQPVKNFDPGRVRFEALFVTMYGDCKGNGVTQNLKTINWLPKHGGGRISITSINGVDKALGAVSRELDEFPATDIQYLKPTAGTYNCRPVAGTSVRSMHAYAAALDINAAFSDYWRWDSRPGREPVWKNKIPIDIVRAFERQGFIWGGYWYHYDTMHFEYRPELLPVVSRVN